MEELNNQLNLLSPLLTKNDCASCKFCCSFRRQSLWESPVFDEQTMLELQRLFPNAKFRPAGEGKSSWTFDISADYKTDDPQEEVVCPFLNAQNGCSLPPELKPFDCKIWPLRAVRTEESLEPVVALTPTCPAINKLPVEKVRDLVNSGLGKSILEYAATHPDIIKDYCSHHFILLK
ncbi:MAG: hypothetical protein IKR45_06050 [Treponema sp.]|nr:hypothetical protein [Treponema sp.]